MSRSTSKRRSESRHSLGEKKPRSCFLVTDSFENDNPGYRCSACETELVEDTSVCINVDLPASVYFSLALIMTDCSKYNLLDHYYENPTIKSLAQYANRLAVDRDLANGALDVLRVLLQDFEENGLRTVRGLMKETLLHHERELKFISACLSDMKIAVRDMISDQSTTIDWEAILMLDIRFARLVPLFAILKDSPSKDDLISPMSSFVSLPEVFDDDEDNIVSSSFEAQHDHTMDSVYIHSSSEENSVRNFILPRASSIFNSQESARLPDTQITAEFSVTSPEFNTPSSQWDPTTNNSNSSSSNDIRIIQEEEQDMPSLDIPNYEEFTTAELKSKLKTYGYKTGNNRNQMIKDLRTIYTSIHSSKSTMLDTATATTCFSDILMTSDIEQDVIFDLSIQEATSSSQKTVDPIVKENIIRHLKSTNIWQKILTFEPVTIEECVVGTKFRKSDIKSVLDEAASILNKKKVI